LYELFLGPIYTKNNPFIRFFSGKALGYDLFLVDYIITSNNARSILSYEKSIFNLLKFYMNKK
jgi:hypothetical protein